MSPDGAAARMRSWRMLVFGSTWWAYAGLYFCRKAFYAVKAALGSQLGFDAIDLGTIGTIYLVAYALGQFLAGSLGQRLGARRLLLVGMATSVLANVVFAFGTSFWTFAAFMGLNGLAQATGWSTCMGILGNWTTRRERGTVVGMWATCYQLGGVMATSWAGLWLGITFGELGAGARPDAWRQSFLAGAAVLFVAWVAVLLLTRDRPQSVGLAPLDEDSQSSGADAGAPFRWTRELVTTILLVGVCYMGIKLVRYTIWSWSAFLLRNVYHLSDGAAAQYSTVFDVAGFAAVIIAGVVSDRVFGGRRALLSFIMLGGMTVACVLLYAKGTDSLPWFIGGMVCAGFMLYGPDSLLSGAGAIDLGSRRAAVATAGIINGMGSVGPVIQELGVGSLYEGSSHRVGPVFALLICASLMSMVALGVVLLRNRRGLSDL